MGRGLSGEWLDQAVDAVMEGLALVADEWAAESSTYYYQHRNTGPIEYARGFEEGWDHAGDLLRGEEHEPPNANWDQVR